MKSRIQTPVLRRASLPLTQKNENDLRSLLESSSYQNALEELSGTKIADKALSSSAILHAIFEVGMTTLKQKAELDGYAEIASAQGKLEVRSHRKDARRRRPSWADEE
jgi:hypothetical protein